MAYHSSEWPREKLAVCLAIGPSWWHLLDGPVVSDESSGLFLLLDIALNPSTVYLYFEFSGFQEENE